MPYRKYPYKRSYPTQYRRRPMAMVRRQPYQSGLSSALSTASRALSVAYGLKSIINSELKHYDESGTSTPDGASGSIVGILRGMAQGDTNNTFDGNSILCKSVQVRFSTNMNASATSTRVRCMYRS